ncbi:MAG: ROK family protein [Oscillospiraceae bacterium]|nr:ROK family protein [Oscillospiraceae bacterium]
MDIQKQKAYLGVDIGGSHFSVVAINAKAEVLNEATYYGSFTNASEGKQSDELTEKEKEIIEILSGLIIEVCNGLDKNIYETNTIGFGFPGMFEGTKIKSLTNIGIRNLDIWEELKKNINRKREQGETELNPEEFSVHIENDATIAFVSELNPEDEQSFIIVMGTGCGTKSAKKGIITDNKLELGHADIRLDSNDEREVGDQEPECGCGEPYCIERYISVKRYREYVSKLLGYQERTINGIEMRYVLNKVLNRNNAEEIEEQILDKERNNEKTRELISKTEGLDSEEQKLIKIRQGIWMKAIAKGAKYIINATSDNGEVKCILSGSGQKLLSKEDLQFIENKINNGKGPKKDTHCTVQIASITDPAIGAALLPIYYERVM